MNTGVYEVFRSFDYWDDFAQIILASGSAPGYFPPQKIFDRLWMDGGSAFNLELPSLVNYCR